MRLLATIVKETIGKLNKIKSNDRETLNQSISPLIIFLQKNPDQRAVLYRTSFALLAVPILRSISGNYEIANSLFTNAPWDVALRAFTSALATGESGVGDAVLYYLNFLFDRPLIKLLEAVQEGISSSRTYPPGDSKTGISIPQTTALQSETLRCLGAIPDLIANHCGRELPERWQSRNYFQRLTIGAIAALEERNGKLEVTNGAALVLAKVCKHGRGKFVGEYLARKMRRSLKRVQGELCIQGIEKTKKLGELVTLVALCHSSPQTFLKGVLLGIATTRRSVGVKRIMVESALGGLLHAGSSRSTSGPMNTLCSRFLSVRVLPIRALDLLIWLHVKILPDQNRRKLMLKPLLMKWSMTSFVHRTSLSQHRYVTRALLLLIRADQGTRSEGESSKSETLLHMLSAECLRGVQARLGSEIEEVRQCGMIIGEAYAKLLPKTEKPLDFEQDYSKLFPSGSELSDAMSSTDDRDTTDDEIDPSGHQQKSVVRMVELPESVVVNDKISPAIDDSTQWPEWAADKRPWDDFGASDDSDELEPMKGAFDQEGGKSEVPEPKYLRTCWDYLRKDDRAHIESAIEHVEAVIRRNPPDLKHIAPQITATLLHRSNDYYVEGYHEKRIGAISALMASNPESVGMYLAKQVFNSECTGACRRDTLECILRGARELAGISNGWTPEHNSRETLPAPPKKAITPISISQSKRWKEIDMRVAKKTRRFARATVKPKIIQSRFNEAAPSVFYPLLNQYLNAGHLPAGNDGTFGRFVFTLGGLVECAGKSRHTIKMGKDLLDLLWLTRGHKSMEVRRSTYYALSRVLLNIPGQMLIRELGGRGIGDWIGNLREIADGGDIDSQTRSMASFCLSELSRRVRPILAPQIKQITF